MRAFAQSYPVYAYKKGDILVRAGDAPEDVYFIVHGKVSQIDIAPNGSEIVVNVFAKPSFLSIFWIFDGAPNRYTYQALGDVRVHKAPKSAVQKFMLGNSEVMYVTMQRLVRGLDGFMARMAYQMYGSAEKKTAAELLFEAKRFHKNATVNITLDSSVNDLSARTGLARETVSRQVGSLLQKELIAKSGNRITIVDLAELEDYVTSE